MLRWLSGFRVFSSCLGWSEVFSSFLELSLVLSGFLALSRISCSFGDPAGCLWVPSGSLCVLRGPFGVPLVCPRASVRALWAPLASLGGRLGVPLGHLWGLFGRFGLTWAARGRPGVPKVPENQKTRVFVCFCPCVKKHVFLCVSRGGRGSMQQNTRVFVCFRVFEAAGALSQNIRVFVCF